MLLLWKGFVSDTCCFSSRRVVSISFKYPFDKIHLLYNESRKLVRFQDLRVTPYKQYL